MATKLPTKEEVLTDLFDLCAQVNPMPHVCTPETSLAEIGIKGKDLFPKFIRWIETRWNITIPGVALLNFSRGTLGGIAEYIYIILSSAKTPTILLKDILEILPHRYPFVMIDRIQSAEPDFDPPQIRSLKNVTINEPFFQGHFPEEPIMPAVLILEGMAQTAGILLYYLLEDDLVEDKVPGFFAGVGKAKFRKKIIPGDQINYLVQLKQSSRVVYKFTALAEVAGYKVSEAIITIAKN